VRKNQALKTYTKLIRAAGTTATRIQRGVMAQEKLTESQAGVLEALLHLGPLTHSQLANKLLKTGGNITMVIDNLEKRSLVERVPSPADRRAVEVHLTARGQRLIERVFPRLVAEIEDQMSALTPAEQKELGRLCRKLGLQRG
jgi:MarR family 2-MHQ and catechol resistance regulon transcriptional repressor